MGVFSKEYMVTGNLRSHIVQVIYNTDARDSLVRRDIAEGLGDIAALPSHMLIKANNVHDALNVYHSASLDIDVDGVRLMHHFFVVDGLDEELVVGADMIRKWKISLDLDNETVSIDPRAESLVRRTGIAIPIPASGE